MMGDKENDPLSINRINGNYIDSDDDSISISRKKGHGKRRIILHESDSDNENSNNNDNNNENATPSIPGGISVSNTTTNNNNDDLPTDNNSPVRPPAASISASMVAPTPNTRQYNLYIRKAKTAEQSGQHNEALEAYESAYGLINTSDKLRRKIELLRIKIEKSKCSCSINQIQENNGLAFIYNPDTQLFHLKCEGSTHHHYSIPPSLYNSLYPYQKDCISWLGKLFQAKQGGILADEMGLGKTIQILTFLFGLFHSKLISRVLILAPVSVIPHWQSEINKWMQIANLNINICVFYGNNVLKRNKEFDDLVINSKYSICLSTYGMMNSLTNIQKLTENGLLWDYLITDEGHKLKSPSTLLYKQLLTLNCTRRLILTGTTIQNSLIELHSLINFIDSNHSILGSKKVFQEQFSTAISAGSDKAANKKQKALAEQLILELRNIIAPYMLRRMKSQVLGQLNQINKQFNDNISTELMQENSLNIPRIPAKSDLTIWIYLSLDQLQVYKSFIESDTVRKTLNSTRSPLAALTILKKLCDHPRLLTSSMKMCESLALNTEFQIIQQEGKKPLVQYNIQTLLKESIKLHVLMELLLQHRLEGVKTLIFSQSRKMLDLIEQCMQFNEFSYIRLDGTISSPQQRQELVNKFNENPLISCCLLTTGVGGVGIELTSASRVIIFDPAWNPSIDTQAIARAYRIGQKNNVIAYRFITCSTIEEVIYRKQIFKAALSKIDTDLEQKSNDLCPQNKEEIENNNNNNEEVISHRYFTRAELHQCFSVPDSRTSATAIQLHATHPIQLKPELKDHINFLRGDLKPYIFQVTDHELLFSKQDQIIEEEDKEEPEELPVSNKDKEDNIDKLAVNEAGASTASDATAILKQSSWVAQYEAEQVKRSITAQLEQGPLPIRSYKRRGNRRPPVRQREYNNINIAQPLLNNVRPNYEHYPHENRIQDDEEEDEDNDEYDDEEKEEQKEISPFKSISLDPIPIPILLQEDEYQNEMDIQKEEIPQYDPIEGDQEFGIDATNDEEPKIEIIEQKEKETETETGPEDTLETDETPYHLAILPETPDIHSNCIEQFTTTEKEELELEPGAAIEEEDIVNPIIPSTEEQEFEPGSENIVAPGGPIQEIKPIENNNNISRIDIELPPPTSPFAFASAPPEELQEEEEMQQITQSFHNISIFEDSRISDSSVVEEAKEENSSLSKEYTVELLGVSGPVKFSYTIPIEAQQKLLTAEEIAQYDEYIQLAADSLCAEDYLRGLYYSLLALKIDGRDPNLHVQVIALRQRLQEKDNNTENDSSF